MTARRVELELETPDQRRALVLTIIRRDGWELEAEVIRAAGELGIEAHEVAGHVRDLLVTGAVERRERRMEGGVVVRALFPARPGRVVRVRR